MMLKMAVETLEQASERSTDPGVQKRVDEAVAQLEQTLLSMESSAKEAKRQRDEAAAAAADATAAASHDNEQQLASKVEGLVV